MVTVDTNDCWLFAGSKTLQGYGLIGSDSTSKKILAHRAMYEAYRSDIPVGLVIDHLCETPPCINPDHLEVVTVRENTRRGYRGRTHCRKGHLLTSASSEIRLMPSNQRPSNPTGEIRVCLTCRQIKVEERKRLKSVRTPVQRRKVRHST